MNFIPLFTKRDDYGTRSDFSKRIAFSGRNDFSVRDAFTGLYPTGGISPYAFLFMDNTEFMFMDSTSFEFMN